MLRNKHLEVAAKFHVLSVLHSLGLEANLALTQPDSVDIAALGPDGQTVTIDVKIVEGKREWLVDHFRARKHHYVVVVAFSSENEGVVMRQRAYVIASETLQKFVSRRKLKSVPLDVLKTELAALDAWSLITAEHAA